MFYRDLEAIEEILKHGYEAFTWDNDETKVKKFISEATQAMKKLYDKVVNLKENQGKIEQLLRDWASVSLLEKPLKGTLPINACLEQIETRAKTVVGGESVRIAECIADSKYVVFGLKDFDKEREVANGLEEEEVTAAEGDDAPDDAAEQGDAEQRALEADAAALQRAAAEKAAAEAAELERARMMTKAIASNPELLKHWENYLVWLAEFIQTGILQIVLSNVARIQFWMDDAETAEHNDNSTQSDKINENALPLIEVSMVLYPPELLFEPMLAAARPCRPRAENLMVLFPCARSR